MRIYKTKKVSYNKKVLKEIKCDLCGFKAKTEEWNATIFEIKETEVKISVRHKSGNSYPEGGFGEEFYVDICPKCFQEKLIPWLKSQCENSIDYKEWDW